VVSEGGAEAVDTFMDLYVGWRERARAVHVSSERWDRAADADERADAFAGFSSALEEEGRAARRFGEFLAQADVFAAAGAGEP